MAPLNVIELDELFERGGDNPEIVNRWYEELSEVSANLFVNIISELHLIN